MHKEFTHRSKPILLIMISSVLILVLLVLAKQSIESFLFGGYTIILLLLLGVISTCTWIYISALWNKLNNAQRYILVGSFILLFTFLYFSKLIVLNSNGEDGLYPLLADAFANGQFSLLSLPSPELLALPDPYDPIANNGLRLHDALLFNGKYYIYFGPVPAVILLVVNWLYRVGVGNEFLMIFFLSIISLMVFLLIYRFWQRNYLHVSWKIPLLCFVVVVWSLPMMWMVGRPEVYESAILGGQAFLLTGLYFLLIALDAGKSQNLLLTLAGSAFGLAVGTRWNMAVPVLLVSALVMILLVGQLSQKKLSMKLKPLLAYFLPLVLFAIIYMYYNFARFGSPFDLGIKYVLTGHEQRNSNLFSFENIKNNLIRYFLIPPKELRFEYPFIFYVGSKNNDILAIYGVTPHPRIGYLGTEVLSAIYWVAPLLFAGFYPVFSLFRNFARYCRMRRSELNFADWLKEKEQYYSLFLILFAIGGFIPLLTFFYSTMRYHMDYFPALGLLAAIGILNLYVVLSKTLYCDFGKYVFLFSSLYTVIIGVIASITSQYNNFAIMNPTAIKLLDTAALIFKNAFIK